MDSHKQEIDCDLFYLDSKSRGLTLLKSLKKPELFSIHSPYCYWIGIENKIGSVVKYEGHFYCESVGKDSSDASDEEKIAFYISNLPNEDWAIDLNFAQMCEWIIHRTLAIRIAKCFLVGHSQSNQLLLLELNQGTIDQYQIEYNLLLTDRLENIWKLISRKEKKIKTALARQWEYPFKNCLELFQEIVRPLIEGNFVECFEKNHINRPREIKKLATFSRNQLKNNDLSIAQKETLEKLIQKYHPHNPWRDRVIQVASILAEKDDLIRPHLEIDKVLTDALLAMNQKAYSDPKFKRHAEKPYAWRKGVWYPS